MYLSLYTLDRHHICSLFFEDRTKLKNRSWDLSTFEDYDGSTNHDIFMHRCILKSDQELRISARLNWTLGLNNWKKADFLLKSDPKLGGVLMYNTSSSGKITVSITVDKFFIMSMKFDKIILDWSHYCTDYKNGLDFFFRLVKWPKIAVKKSQNFQKF